MAVPAHLLGPRRQRRHLSDILRAQLPLDLLQIGLVVRPLVQHAHRRLVTRQFDRSAYDAFLQQLQYNRAEFETDMRGDITREVDVIEEVARHQGLDRLPSTIPAAGGAEGLRPGQVRDRRLRDILAGAGLDEAITYSFVPAGGPVAAGPVLANPLSEDHKVLRTSLVWPGLLAVMRINLRQSKDDVRIFEAGRVFDGKGERSRVAVLLTGAASPVHHGDRARATDFFDLKGVLEGLAARLGIGHVQMTAGGAPEFLHPGQSAAVRVAGHAIGYAGALHPDRAEEWEARAPVFVAEIDVEALPAAASVRAKALPRFPAVERDLSVLCSAGAQAVDLGEAIRDAAGPRLQSADVTARYDRPPVPPGQVSLTFRLVFQDASRTLTGEEVQAAMDAVAAALRARGHEIRGE